jgi:thymidylate synthase ThyX
MTVVTDTDPYALDFPGETWTSEERWALEAFATNVDGHVAVLRNMPPELAGALCSRASRAPGYLLRVFYNEYLKPILEGEDKDAAAGLREMIEFFRSDRRELLTKKGRQFYAKWLAQYGDDSIAQMTGVHIVFWGISQVAMKVAEDQRIAFEPIEKSTRYVKFSEKVAGKYLYYTPRPDLQAYGLEQEYVRTMDHLFEANVDLQKPLIAWLRANFDEKDAVLEKKAFDTLRGLLPMATLGQVAFRGNAQALEYLVNRSAKHKVGELRSLSQVIRTELNREIPSLMLRVNDAKSGEYQQYLGEKDARIDGFIASQWGHMEDSDFTEVGAKPEVRLVDFDDEAEISIATGILYPRLHCSWEKAREVARGLSGQDRRDLLSAYVHGRTARWQKLGRAFENAYLRFDITMNIGAYRDLQRHRMMTQQRQKFSTHHGFDLPAEVVDAGLADRFEEAMERAARLFVKIERHDPDLAQYVVPLAYRIRFQQFQNFRNFSWEVELRTGSQGHPDYRLIEQQKFELVKAVFPELAGIILADMNQYSVARRGVDEGIARKEQRILEGIKDK